MVDDDMANLRGCPCGVVHVATKRGVGPFEVYLALIPHKVFIKLFCKSQLQHKSFNVFYISTIVENLLMDLCGN